MTTSLHFSRCVQVYSDLEYPSQSDIFDTQDPHVFMCSSKRRRVTPQLNIERKLHLGEGCLGWLGAKPIADLTQKDTVSSGSLRF